MTRYLNRIEKIRVTKKFTFDMAHALYCYDGPCCNIHGHTYHLSVTMLGSPINDKENPKDGMVVDFTEIKQMVNETIISHFDHALVLNKKTSKNVTKALGEQFDKVLLVSFQPTCENLLIEFKNRLQEIFNKEGINLVYLKLEETPTSYSEWIYNENITNGKNNTHVH